MTPEEANRLREKYAAAEKATDSLLVRLGNSPWTFAILVVAFAAACIAVIVVTV